MESKRQLHNFHFETLASKRLLIFTYVLSVMRDSEAAEDITQETMLKAFRNISNLTDHTRLTPWLYRIATNICRDHFRRNGRIQERFQNNNAIDDMQNESGPKLDKLLECNEMGECVQQYIAELSDPYRAVILLHDVEGMTNQEIADMLNISLDTAKIRLHRARKRLREILQDVCHFSIDERGVLICEPKAKGV